MAKIERKYLAHYLNAGTSELPDYVRLGKDLDELSTEMSAQVDTKHNILGETSVNVTSYEKSASVEPYFAEKGDKLFDRLQKIIDEDQVLDDVRTDYVEVKLWDQDSAGAFPCIKEEVVIEVTSYGGDTSGYQIGFTIHHTGVKVKGTFNPKTKEFTPAEA